MTDATQSRPGVFRSGGHGEVTWDRARELLAPRRTPDDTTDRLREETAVSNLLSRYAYTFDSRDLDGIMQFFTDDCAIINPHGTFWGAAAIRAHYEHILRVNRHTFHLWSNVVVGLSDDLHSGRVSAYFLAMLERDQGPPRAVGGLLVDDVTKTDAWRIRARSTTFEFTTQLTPAEQ
jgi:uncharacterized protein (TIGR02246 family)